jgi:hypothetical protein
MPVGEASCEIVLLEYAQRPSPKSSKSTRHPARFTLPSRQARGPCATDIEAPATCLSSLFTRRSIRAVPDEGSTSISANLLHDRAILYGLRAKSSRVLFLENDYNCSPFRSFHARAFVISRICELVVPMLKLFRRLRATTSLHWSCCRRAPERRSQVLSDSLDHGSAYCLASSKCPQALPVQAQISDTTTGPPWSFRCSSDIYLDNGLQRLTAIAPK